jgi:hypothetical protein
MGFNNGSGSSPSIAGSSDVFLNNPVTNNVLTYDTTIAKWKNGSVVATGEYSFNPLDYGAIGDGDPANADADTAGWKAALAAAAAVGGPLVRASVIAPSGIFHINDTLTWNLKISIDGYAQLNCVITDPNKYMWQTVSTSPTDLGSPIRQRATTMRHLIMWCEDGVANGISISGTTSSNKPGHINFENTVWHGFKTGVYFGTHAYMISFSQSNIQGNALGILHDDAENSGERLVFNDCDITGNAKAFELSSGQALHFLTCSFSYNARQLGSTTNGQVYFLNCHIEGRQPYAPWVSMTGSGSLVDFADCRFLIGPQQGYAFGATITGSTGIVTTTVNTSILVGDQITFGAISGVSGIQPDTAYFIRSKPTPKTFTLSATSGGSALSMSGNGTASGVMPTGDFPVVSTTSPLQKVTVRGGHLSGSVSDMSHFSTGPGSVTIRETQTFNNSALLLHSNDQSSSLLSPGYESATVEDDWRLVTALTDTIQTSTSISHSGSRSLLFIHQFKGQASTASLYYPIERGARVLAEFYWYLPDASSSFAVYIRYADDRKSDGLGSILASSTLNGADAWNRYRRTTAYYQSAPLWAKYFVIQIDLLDLANNGRLYIDDMKISQN